MKFYICTKSLLCTEHESLYTQDWPWPGVIFNQFKQRLQTNDIGQVRVYTVNMFGLTDVIQFLRRQVAMNLTNIMMFIRTSSHYCQSCCKCSKILCISLIFLCKHE